jgi:hypothetical protein
VIWINWKRGKYYWQRSLRYHNSSDFVFTNDDDEDADEDNDDYDLQREKVNAEDLKIYVHSLCYLKNQTNLL